MVHGQLFAEVTLGKFTPNSTNISGHLHLNRLAFVTAVVDPQIALIDIDRTVLLFDHQKLAVAVDYIEINLAINRSCV